MSAAAIATSFGGPRGRTARWLRGVGPARWSRLAAGALALLAVFDLLDGGIGALHAATAIAGSWSPGVVVHALDPHLRTALLGLAAWAFVRQHGPRAGETTLDHSRRIAHRFASGGSWAVGEIGVLLVLAGYRDVMRGELFATRHGEAQFAGSLSLSDLLGPATFALAVAMMAVATARWARATAAGAPPSELSPLEARPVPREVTWVGFGLLLGCLFAVRHYFDPASGSLGGNARVALIEAWQCWLLGHWLLGARWPRLSRADLRRWLAEGWAPLTLVVALEALRVAWREDGPRASFAWLAGAVDRTPDALSFLSGRIHDWAGIALAAAVLAGALAVWLAGMRRDQPGAST